MEDLLVTPKQIDTLVETLKDIKNEFSGLEFGIEVSNTDEDIKVKVKVTREEFYNINSEGGFYG